MRLRNYKAKGFMKPSEFWIDEHNDMASDCTWPHAITDEIHAQSTFVHVIEYAAYEIVKAERDHAIDELKYSMQQNQVLNDTLQAFTKDNKLLRESFNVSVPSDEWHDTKMAAFEAKGIFKIIVEPERFSVNQRVFDMAVAWLARRSLEKKK